MERFDGLAASAIAPVRQALELVAQFVQEERLDHLQNISLGCVVRSLGAALGRVHNGLE